MPAALVSRFAVFNFINLDFRGINQIRQQNIAVPHWEFPYWLRTYLNYLGDGFLTGTVPISIIWAMVSLLAPYLPQLPGRWFPYWLRTYLNYLGDGFLAGSVPISITWVMVSLLAPYLSQLPGRWFPYWLRTYLNYLGDSFLTGSVPISITWAMILNLLK